MIELRLSTLAGATGDSVPGTPAGSLGKYLSTSTMVNGGLHNLFREATGLEAEEGHTDYRCFFVVNTGANPYSNVGVWIAAQEPGGADISIGLDPEGVTAEDASDPQAAAIASETEAPSGVTFSLPTTPTVMLAAGDVAPGECFAVWVRRKVPVGSEARGADGALLVIQGIEES